MNSSTITLVIILLTSGFANHCIAIDPDLSLNQNLVPIASRVTRWIELHNRIYDDFSGAQMDLDELRLIISEMSSIEGTDLGGHTFVESGRYRIKDYKHLINISHEAKMVIKKAASVTDLLSQILDHGSNDCTVRYFKLMNVIQETFVNLPTAKALQQNRDLQIQNCLYRLILPAVAMSETLGSRAKDILSKFVDHLYPESSKLKEFSLDKISAEYCKESMNIGQTIAQVLESIASIDGLLDDRDFQYLVLHPCELLIEKTQHIMSDLYVLLRAIGQSRDFITPEHALILNRYMLCQKILGDTDLIRSIVMQYNLMENKAAKLASNRSPNMAISEEIGTSCGFKNALEPRHVTSQVELEVAGDDESNHLVTQYRPLEDKRADMVVSQGGHGKQGSHVIAEGEKHRQDSAVSQLSVTKVERGIRNGMKFEYPTVWSDGSRSMETRSYLLANWPDQINKMIKNRNNLSRKVQRGLSKRKTAELGQISARAKRQKISEVSLDATVVSIEKGVGYGINIEYPTIWSDGQVSNEKKDYLKVNWPEAWRSYVARLKYIHELNYKKRLHDSINREKNKPARRITILESTNPMIISESEQEILDRTRTEKIIPSTQLSKLSNLKQHETSRPLINRISSLAIEKAPIRDKQRGHASQTPTPGSLGRSQLPVPIQDLLGLETDSLGASSHSKLSQTIASRQAKPYEQPDVDLSIGLSLNKHSAERSS